MSVSSTRNDSFEKKVLKIFKGVKFVLLLITCFTLSVLWHIIAELKLTLDHVLHNKIQWDIKFSAKHFKQLICVTIHTYIVLGLSGTHCIFSVALLYYFNNLGRYLLLTYWVYIYYDHYTNYTTSNTIRSLTLRNNFIGRCARSYYPVELVKTTELPPDRNYLFAVFPHGLMCFGSAVNMILDIGKWLELFPGIRPFIATLDLQFCIPIANTIGKSLGVVSASKEELVWYLNKSNDPIHPDNIDGFTSNAIGIVVGGAKEAAISHPGVHKIYLRNRKGFVKVAIETGSSIVPSFSFNEVELYYQKSIKPGTLNHRFERFTFKLFGYIPIYVFGRGFFQTTFGVLPRKERVVQVVGAPIHVVKSSTPDPAYVDEIHEKVMHAITEIFETHKKFYIKDHKNAELIII